MNGKQNWKKCKYILFNLNKHIPKYEMNQEYQADSTSPNEFTFFFQENSQSLRIEEI